MIVRHIFEFAKFFSEAANYVQADNCAVAEVQHDASQHVAIHRRIVIVSVVFGVIGAACGVAMIVFAAHGVPPLKDDQSFFLAPVAFAALGCVLGAAAATAFAPTRFLTGPVGRKWMGLVGKESVLVVRIVYSIFLLLPLAIVASAGLSVWLGLQHAK